MKKRKMNNDHLTNEFSAIISPLCEEIDPPKTLFPLQITHEITEKAPARTKQPVKPLYIRAAAVFCLTAVIIGTAYGTGVFQETKLSGAPANMPEADFASGRASDERDNAVTKNEAAKTGPQKEAPAYNSDSNYTRKDPSSTAKNSYEAILQIAKIQGAQSGNIYYSRNGLWPSTDAGVDTDSGGGNEQVYGSYGKTNTQNEVDEADIVKTDGKYVYTLPHGYDYEDNLYLNIVDVKNPSVPFLSTAIQYKLSGSEKAGGKVFYPKEMYVDGELLVVAGNIRVYLSDFNYTLSTQAVVYDISGLDQKQEPKAVRTFKQDGEYSSSRYDSGRLYLISSYFPSYDLEDLEKTTKISELVPSASDSSFNGGGASLVAEQNITVMPGQNRINYTVTSAVDCRNVTVKAGTVAVLGDGSTVYASKNSLYIASAEYGQSADNSSLEKTNIVKLDLTGPKIKTAGNLKVDGRLLNQFSMDEYNGYFRVAATIRTRKSVGSGGILTTNSAVSVYDQNLKLAGKVDGLAENENIYSVRFMNSMAYVVTFRQTDPLFAIDLSDPSKPKVLGELKIPGFSNYLHPISKDYLLGIGEGGDEDGNINGFKVSVFDVSNPKNPVEKSNLVYENTYSEANKNHKAILFIKDRDLFCIPVYSGGENSILILKVDQKGTMKKIAKVKSDENAELRATYSGNVLYMISDSRVTAYSLDSFKKLSSCKLKQGALKEYPICVD